jgi:glycosyltransferase involved in cell wall biosynthesis
MKGVSAYVPCFNNGASVGRALTSIQRQSIPVDQLFLVDDGSTDGSRAVAEQLGVRVVAMERNGGRGAVRAMAMEHARHELVLCCDATNHLPDDFLERASRWFVDPRVAAVVGRIWQVESTALADRWRGRHLFKVQEAMAVQHRALLSTYGCVLRREVVMQVGNFDRSLRHSEDADLGRRLLDAGFDVVFDPELHCISGVTNTVHQVLERYWRWYAGTNEAISFRGYAKQTWYALKVMAMRDLRDGDLLSVPISLFAPHYQFWKSWASRCSARVQSRG